MNSRSPDYNDNTTKSKKVRFVDDNVAHENVWIYESYSTDILWATKKEYKESKRCANLRALKVKQVGVNTLLRGAFTAMTDKSVQRPLNDYVKSKADVRGLEKLVSRDNYEVRRQHRGRAIKVVLMAQAEAKKRGYDMNEMTEELRQLSIKFTVNAKIFARRMGKADEACCYPSRESQKATQAPLKKMKTGTEPALNAGSSQQSASSSSSSSSLPKSRLSQRHLQAMIAS